ncbi:MAG: hypothetical protein ABI134_21215 [Byssovorax sp.]
MTQGSLLVLLKSKVEADAFYRLTSSPPGEPAVKDTQVPAAPPGCLRAVSKRRMI